MYPPSIRGCEYTKHPSAQHNAERFVKSFNRVDKLQNHVVTAPNIDVVYVHGLGSQIGSASTKRPSAWRIAKEFGKPDSTVEKSFNQAGLFRSHLINVFDLGRNDIPPENSIDYIS
jgi:hypothetical protein